jgi:hypothetical protein
MRNHPEFQLTKAYSPDPVAMPESHSQSLPGKQTTTMRSNQVRKAKPRSKRPSILKT